MIVIISIIAFVSDFWTMKEKNNIALTTLAALLTAGIFISDAFTPLGIAWGFIYIIVVLITLWVPGKTATIIFALVGIALTAFCFLIKPTPVIPSYIVVTNRTLSLGGILITMFGILKYKSKEAHVQKQKQELEKLADELKNSNSDLEQFAYVASHDLQEPLRKIQSFGERVVYMEKEKLSETGKDYLERIMSAAERMQTLINDLLSFSRLTTRAEPFTKVDLNKIVREVLGDLDVLIEKTKAHIEIGKLPAVNADPTQMRQLVQNLISNAIKFSKEAERPEIIITSDNIHDENFAKIYFADNGIGFDEKYAEKIFNIFQRLEGKKYEGSGIGLAVCKKIVQRHGGSISVRSKIGEGSEFTVILPVNSAV